jgi:hypothetical protein
MNFAFHALFLCCGVKYLQKQNFRKWN